MRSLSAIALLLLLTASNASGQATDYVGLVSEIQGKWDLLDTEGRKIADLRTYVAIPRGSSVRITPGRGGASGHLTVALSDGSTFVRCCNSACKTKDTNCGETVTITFSGRKQTWANTLDKIGSLLFPSSESYAPAIGGYVRGISGSQQPSDGVFVSDPNSPVHFDPGFYRVTAVRDEAGRENGDSAWILIVRDANDPALSLYSVFVTETRGLDESVAGILRRTYLVYLAEKR
jgi:hypothetical protein